MKTILIAAALGSLAFAATPLSARVDGPKDLRDADKGCPSAGLLLPAVQKVREAPAPSKRGHVKVFDGASGAGVRANAAPDAAEARATPPARMKATNNLKQVGLANHCDQ